MSKAKIGIGIAFVLVILLAIYFFQFVSKTNVKELSASTQVFNIIVNDSANNSENSLSIASVTEKQENETEINKNSKQENNLHSEFNTNKSNQQYAKKQDKENNSQHEDAKPKSNVDVSEENNTKATNTDINNSKTQNITDQVENSTSNNNEIKENQDNSKSTAKQKLLNSIYQPTENIHRKNGMIEFKFNKTEAFKVAQAIIDESFNYGKFWNGEKLLYKIEFRYKENIMQDSMYWPFRETAIKSAVKNKNTNSTFYIWAEDYIENGQKVHTQYCIR